MESLDPLEYARQQLRSNPGYVVLHRQLMRGYVSEPQFPPSPQQRRAFNSLYRVFRDTTWRSGLPVAAITEDATGFVTIDPSTTRPKGRQYPVNASVGRFCITDTDGRARQAAATILHDDVVTPTGMVGEFRVSIDPRRPRLATVYKFYEHENVAVVHTDMPPKSCDDLDVLPLGWLEAAHMVELEQMIVGAKAL